MEIFIVVGLILVGLILVYIELFLLPGVFIVGIFGGIAMIAGVYLSYNYFGPNGGHLTLGISVGLLIYSLILGYRKITSKKWSLSKTIEGKVSRVEEDKVKVGDKGVTFTVIKPTGKAMFGGEKLEVHSMGEYIDNNIEIEVSKIALNKIFVKPVSANSTP